MPYGGQLTGGWTASPNRPLSPNGAPYDPNIPDWMIPGYGAGWGAAGNGSASPAPWSWSGSGAPDPMNTDNFVPWAMGADLGAGDYQGRTSRALGASMQEGFRLRDEEDNRYRETRGFLENQFAAANQPTISDQMARQMYSREADQIGSGSLRDLSGLRSSLGGAGITGGGLAAGLGAQIELARLGQLTGAKREVAITKAQTDAEDRARQFQRAMGLGEFMNQSPSMIGLDVLGSMSDIRLGQELGERQVEAASRSARATERAGKTAAAGSVLSGALGAI